MKLTLEESQDSMQEDKDKEIETFSEQCDLLQMRTIPTFGKYNKDYTFLEQVLILKSDNPPKNIPQNLKSKLDNFKNRHPDIKPDYFHITLSASTLISPNSENDVNSSYTLLNLITHPYIFYNSKFGNNCRKHESKIYCAVFTEDEEIDTLKEIKKNDIEKIKENNDKDILTQLLRLNPECELDNDKLKRDVILHLNDDNYISLSPNNCGILINLNAQIINFYVVVCGTYGNDIVKCFVGNFVIIPNANNSGLFGDLYHQMIKEKKKDKFVTELLLFRNKYNDYLNYIFSFGLNEIAANAKNLEHIKICLNKIFSLIYDFSINGDEDDENSKKIHEKELLYMQKYYYSNVCKFVSKLYENSEFDPNFGEKFMESSLNNNFIEELLLKYIQYNKSRINNIVLNYEYFIFKDNDILMDLLEKADEKYNEDNLPTLKTLFADLLNEDEEKIQEIKDNYSEENRIHIRNPNIETLINICNAVRNEDDIPPVLDELDEIMKKYLFYIVWIEKGKICDVHNDFGRVSFLNEKEIDKKYFCSDDDKINCCQKLIQYLENADEKKY